MVLLLQVDLFYNLLFAKVWDMAVEIKFIIKFSSK